MHQYLLQKRPFDGGLFSRGFRRVLTTIFLVIMFDFPVQSQTPGSSLVGTITDISHHSISFVTVKLISINNGDQLQAMTDTTGRFIVKGVKPGIYSLTVSAVGYKAPKLQQVTVSQNSNEIKLSPIVLQESSTTLKTVDVVAQRRVIEAGGGKIIFNVDKRPAASGASAYELLQRTPGINADQDGNLLLKGSSAVNVMIDGN